jgi:hypothetical protein
LRHNLYSPQLLELQDQVRSCEDGSEKCIKKYIGNDEGKGLLGKGRGESTIQIYLKAVGDYLIHLAQDGKNIWLLLIR